MDRHDREELFNGPRIGHRLEDREITEIGIGEECLQSAQVFRRVIEFANVLENARADGPEHILGHGAHFERYAAKVEQVDDFIDMVRGVVVRLLQVFLFDIFIDSKKIVQLLRRFFRWRIWNICFVEPGNTQHVEHQKAVVSDHGTAGFGNNGWVRYFLLVADGPHAEDDVAGIFLQCVVDARFEVALGAVVIDTQTATHVEILHPCTHVVQVAVNACGFGEGILDAADVGDLAA